MMKIPAKIKCPYCLKEFASHETKMRTIRENKYYWAVPIKILSEETGIMPMEVHEILKNKFLTHIVFLDIKNKKVELESTKQTSSLTTEEFEEYLRNIRTWASLELGIFIPLPNEELKEMT